MCKAATFQVWTQLKKMWLQKATVTVSRRKLLVILLLFIQKLCQNHSKSLTIIIVVQLWTLSRNIKHAEEIHIVRSLLYSRHYKVFKPFDIILTRAPEILSNFKWYLNNILLLCIVHKQGPSFLHTFLAISDNPFNNYCYVNIKTRYDFSVVSMYFYSVIKIVTAISKHIFIHFYLCPRRSLIFVN